MRYITLCAGILLALACGKDKLETKPSIEIKSMSGDMIPVNGNLAITLKFNDKEGDVDSLYVQRIRLNKEKDPPGGRTPPDFFHLQVPEFPEKSTGEILLNFAYSGYLADAITPRDDPNSPTGKLADSIAFRFALMDKSDHTSDTITTAQIVVIRN
ncbi:hypothetical protein HB364_19340 [Pseudoflavitalea sp. X16]|uniref:hypothetical protein n=1 Tax=Paraflavitalea devenefica TaxID=2716334 RepID=UPI0014234496|nr:hypothetical protein [Paraflavitalea devenefica]NII27252.1 hypothetical protein [Paraflavitalea devenefica]